MMSCFLRESKSTAACPEPVDESEGGSDCNDEKLASMHPGDEHSSKKKSKRGDEYPTGEAESI